MAIAPNKQPISQPVGDLNFLNYATHALMLLLLMLVFTTVNIRSMTWLFWLLLGHQAGGKTHRTTRRTEHIHLERNVTKTLFNNSWPRNRYTLYMELSTVN